MIGMNIAPGLSRTFASEEWSLIPQEMWKEERANAYAAITEMPVKASTRPISIRRRCMPPRKTRQKPAWTCTSEFKRADVKELDRLRMNGA